VVVLPSSSLRWATSQPDEVLSASEGNLEVDQMGYTAQHTKFVLDGWQNTLIKRDMNNILERIIVSLNEELVHCFDEKFGTDTTE